MIDDLKKNRNKNELLETARYWLNHGIATIPIQYRDKRPAAKLLPSGKWEGYKTELPTDTELQTWFISSLRNIGLIVGWNNLLVVDFDDIDTYNRWMLWACKMGGLVEMVARRTYQVKTSRGMHVYVFTQNRELNRKLPGIDIKAQGGYVLIPPSIHPSGHVYAAVNEAAHILSINSLADILPSDMLVQAAHETEYRNPGVAATMQAKHVLQSDPWESALHVPDPTRDMILQVRERHHILDYLPDARRTSRDGRWWRAGCPFHEDSNPSFWVDAQRGICGCFGGCTPKALDVIGLYARLAGVTNRDAILYLARI